MPRDAYHTPAMILLIRRANERSATTVGEEVPWRHRLGKNERREFVHAEIHRLGGMSGRERTRGSELDIQRAVNAARNPKDSKFGACLLDVNTKQDPVLKSRLRGITTEMRRMEFRMQQLKQHFVRTNPCLNHEPLILVERPASPKVKVRAKVIEEYGEDPDDYKKPGYMRPLRSRCKTPSTLTTIDAFTLKTKKKRNVWEEAMDEKDPPSFKSTVRPCARLTKMERAALHVGWDAHKPKVDESSATCSTGTRPSSRKKKTRHRASPTQPATDSPFITQLPRKDLAKTPDGRLLENTALDQLLAVSFNKKQDQDALSEIAEERSVGESEDRGVGEPKSVFITQGEMERMAFLYGHAPLSSSKVTSDAAEIDAVGKANERLRSAGTSPVPQPRSADRSGPSSPHEADATSAVMVVAKPTNHSSTAGRIRPSQDGGTSQSPDDHQPSEGPKLIQVKQDRRRKVAISETPLYVQAS